MAQPEIPGTDVGKVVMPYGSDGSDWIALLVSGLGALQVELASLPTGAVTIADGADVTLGALADAVVAAGAAGSVSSKLRRLTTDIDALLTELKLKADLTETQPISAASLPLPSSAATETTVDAIKTAVEIIDGFADAQNLIFGYNAQYKEEDEATATGAGAANLDLTAVSAGEIWVVTSIAVFHNDTTNRRINLGINSDGIVHTIDMATVAANTPIKAQGHWYLVEDDFIRCRFYSVANGKKVYLYASGYKMKIA